MTQNDAQNYCKRLNGHLVRIGDEREEEFLAEAARKHGLSEFWIGAKQLDPATDGKWYWMVMPVVGSGILWKLWKMILDGNG